MSHSMSLQALLTASNTVPGQPLALFALLTLGILELLAHGLLSATDALRVFFHAENCLFVRKHLRDKTADAVMSHGVQLSDLFEALPTAEAQREFQRELATMRALCLKLLEQKRLVA
jgi:hypothetical protein